MKDRPNRKIFLPQNSMYNFTVKTANLNFAGPLFPGKNGVLKNDSFIAHILGNFGLA